ncbi:MAG: penicillin-insensitive murein endopeptidase [Sandaracinus sp.]|nr:penicillin-insensitive murein endopeptidase [Sandaracinus sp.]
MGSTKRGRLLRGARLDDTPHVRIRNPSQAYGTAELVALIAWAAERVAEEHEGAVLSVGDLSRERGGRLRPHRSHRVGRDADLGFYLRDGTTGRAGRVASFRGPAAWARRAPTEAARPSRSTRRATGA